MFPVMILGPTASGKSEIGLRLARALDGEILNADAMQVYRGLDIGTGKVPHSQRPDIPHHLMDILDPREVFSAGEFRRRTLACLEEVLSRDRRPILVGGTGFYLRALVRTLAPMPAVPTRVRTALNTLLERRGPEALHRMLAFLDPASAARIARRDRQRIERALEVVFSSGRRFSDFQGGEMEGEDRLPFLKIGLDLPRPLLKMRIGERVRRMVEDGWLDEVRGLLDAGIPPDSHAFKSIGYREMTLVAGGTLRLGEAIERIIARTRQFSKRQMTWFRREQGIFWVDASVAEFAYQECLGYIKINE
jgi:tRNA dimethylallyltransferase